MKTYLDCIPCFFQQALRAGRMATDDAEQHKRVLDELGSMLSDVPLESSPPETGRLIYRMVSQITGNPDPFLRQKHDATQYALKIYPALKQMIVESDDSLLTAIRIAIAGNVIDFGPSTDFDIDTTLKEVMQREFAICDYSSFKGRLARAESVLYIGDNAGETVFDRLLIEQLNRPVVYVVRETPVINDATLDDAVRAGIDKVATIVSSGTDAPGTVLSTCTPDFRRMLSDSAFTIAKGQGNYEGLSNSGHPVFFLLMVKCRIIAGDIGATKGDILLKGINT